MSTWKTLLTNVASNAEEKFDQLSNRLRQRLGSDRPLLIIPYNGYATAEHITLRARVLQDQGTHTATDHDSTWDNLLNTYRHIGSREVAHAIIRAQLGEYTADFTANDEGYVTIQLPLDQTSEVFSTWLEVQLSLVDESLAEPVTAVGRALNLPTTAEFGVISDIDDTVLQSSATNYLRAAQLMFLHNARTRLPFAGVAALYQALSADGRNPIFYVSSSPWNLYELLTDFFDFQGLPAGPLFLKDYGITADQFISSGHSKHKLTQIEEILAAYPHLPFVLMGDSGQKDPEIYAEVVAKYPDRIRAIYIRDASADQRDLEVKAITEQLTAENIPTLFAPDSLSIAHHAAGLGLIPVESIASVWIEEQKSAGEQGGRGAGETH